MKKPSIVFDIKSPPYVETSMDVISQVFIECFSLEAHKFSKDSPTHKMIFNNEMSHYKEQVKQFYKEISVTESQSDSLRKYLEEVNRVGLRLDRGAQQNLHIKHVYKMKDSASLQYFCSLHFSFVVKDLFSVCKQKVLIDAVLSFPFLLCLV